MYIHLRTYTPCLYKGWGANELALGWWSEQVPSGAAPALPFHVAFDETEGGSGSGSVSEPTGGSAPSIQVRRLQSGSDLEGGVLTNMSRVPASSPW